MDKLTSLNSKSKETLIKKKLKIPKDRRKLYMQMVLEFYGRHKRLERAKSFHKHKILVNQLDDNLVHSMKNPEFLQFVAQNQEEIFRRVQEEYTEVKSKDPAEKLEKIHILTMVDENVKILGKKQEKREHDWQFKYPNNVVMVDRYPHTAEEFMEDGRKRETHHHENLDVNNKDLRMMMKKEEVRKRLESKNISVAHSQPVKIDFMHSIRRALHKSLSVGLGEEVPDMGLTTKFGDSE